MDEIINNNQNKGQEPAVSPVPAELAIKPAHSCSCSGGCNCPSNGQTGSNPLTQHIPLPPVPAVTSAPVVVAAPLVAAAATAQQVFQIHVRFRDRCKLFNCFSYDGNIKEESNCVVDSDDGPQFGQVVKIPKLIPDGKTDGLMKILRVATPDDVKHYYENIQKEKEAYKSCQQKIEEKNLEMKLVEADYSLDRSKIVFYFTAEKRMDFRELVKDLAYLLKARIEMRQIGVRDEAKMLGGYGCCGRELCCVSFLKDFVPVTIKMAKEQHLPLNQTKISGMCGRLMCCLAYEQGQYDSVKEAALSNARKLQESKDVKPVQVPAREPAKASSTGSAPRPWQNNRKQQNSNQNNNHNKDREQGKQNNQQQKSWYNSHHNKQNSNDNRQVKPVETVKPVVVPVPNQTIPPVQGNTGEKK